MSRKWIAVLSALWLVDVASAVFLIHVVDRQRMNEVPGAPPLTAEVPLSQQADEPVVASTEAPVLQMPMVTIQARAPRGVTQMQGTDDLTPRATKVTHPEAREPAPGR